MALDLSKIIKVDFPTTQYFVEEVIKKQIFLHHTAGNPSGIGCANGWKSNAERIATAFIITGNVKNSKVEKDGDIIQCFSSKHWAYHLGLKGEMFKVFNIPYQSLDKISIGIEICNWGYLTKNSDGTFTNYINNIIPKEEVCELVVPFKGFKYYHSYTDNQIESLRQLLIYLCEKYQISTVYNNEIWDLQKSAFKGINGIYTHNSVRKDKSDVYPHPKLIEMLTNLNNI